jgi:hypothetical protein
VVEGSAKRPIQGTFTEVLLERAARLKATRQRVFISGIEGSHTLEVGVAYHYRGHFIYAYPAGNPIEPVPFSTKKGINIVGLMQDRAPIFNSKAPHLVPESEIAALQRACIHEKEFQKEQEDASKEGTQKALAEEARQEAEDAASTEEEIETTTPVETAAQEPLPTSLPPSRVPSFTTLLVPSRVSSRFGSQVSLEHLSAPYHRASTPLSSVPRIGTVEAPDVASASAFETPTGSGTSYTPHDRGHYLAYSAPGSRHGSVDHTPFVSRPVSPTHGLSVRGPGHGHNSLLRPAASTSRLNQLLAEEGVRRALSPLAEDRPSDRHSGVWDEDMIADLSVAQGWIDPTDIDAFVQTVSRRPSLPSSRQASRPRSRMQSPSPQPTTPDDEMDGGLFLPGLGHPDVIRSTSRNQSRSQSPMPPSAHSGFRMGSVDHDPGSRTPSRQFSPMPPMSTGSPSYDSAESAAYLRCLAQRHYEMENPSSRSHSPLPPTTQDIHHHSLRGGEVQLDQFSRSQTPVMQGPSYLQLSGSRTHSPFPPVMQEIHGQEQRDNTSRPAYQTTAFPTFTSRTPTPTTYAPKPLNTGRPRAASQALNEAYNAANPPASTPRPLIQPNKHDDLGHFNFPSSDARGGTGRSVIGDSETGSSSNPSTIHPRAPKCAIHDETCDGKYVEWLHVTERSRQGSGFVDLFPFIKEEGKEERVMIDWATMRDEERGKLRREGRYPLA